MKASEYRQMIDMVSAANASLRGCRVEERPNEARILRRVLGELRAAAPSRLREADRVRASFVAGAAETALRERGF